MSASSSDEESEPWKKAAKIGVNLIPLAFMVWGLLDPRPRQILQQTVAAGRSVLPYLFGVSALAVVIALGVTVYSIHEL